MSPLNTTNIHRANRMGSCSDGFLLWMLLGGISQYSMRTSRKEHGYSFLTYDITLKRPFYPVTLGTECNNNSIIQTPSRKNKNKIQTTLRLCVIQSLCCPCVELARKFLFPPSDVSVRYKLSGPFFLVFRYGLKI